MLRYLFKPNKFCQPSAYGPIVMIMLSFESLSVMLISQDIVMIALHCVEKDLAFLSQVSAHLLSFKAKQGTDAFQ